MLLSSSFETLPKNLSEIKRLMLKKAVEKYKIITLCPRCNNLTESFTYFTIGDIEILTFWFNTTDNSTHTITHNTIKEKYDYSAADSIRTF